MYCLSVFSCCLKFVCLFVCLFVSKGVPPLWSVPLMRVKGGVPSMGSQFPTPRARQASFPLCTKTEGHACIALGSSNQIRWQWSTTQSRPVPGRSTNHSFKCECSVYSRYHTIKQISQNGSAIITPKLKVFISPNWAQIEADLCVSDMGG